MENILPQLNRFSAAFRNTANDKSMHTQNSYLTFGLGVAVGGIMGGLGIVVGISTIIGTIVWHDHVAEQKKKE
jgi:hypothetical protein